jgi:hypothetical protein
MRAKLVAGAVLAVVVAGCGSTKIVNHTHTVAVVTTTTATETITDVRTVYRKPKPTAPPAGSGASTVHDQDGNPLTVGRPTIYDPATPQQYENPDTGTRYVAVDTTLSNPGSATVTGDANNNIVIVGSDDQDYTASFGSITNCTNFNSGEYTLSPGDAIRGCVVFQLPTSISIKRVQFSYGFGTDTAQWTGPK